MEKTPRELDIERIKLLRYRTALLDIRIEKYLVGCSRYNFAMKRKANTMYNIECLKRRLELD